MSKTGLPMCPQEYEGVNMRATPCTRCKSGWDAALGRCEVPTGAEHLPNAPPPPCPMVDRCQHGIQAAPGVCEVRRAGLVCESAMIWSGMPWEEVFDYELGFNACVVASAEEL